MATYHGMCKNCGSLITIDDSKENCECVFCHCVFPRDEAEKILENPDNYSFANETVNQGNGAVFGNNVTSGDSNGRYDNAEILEEHEVVEHKENVIAGIVGAMLFSLIGGALWFILYQTKVVTMSMDMIIVMFGVGNIVHWVVSLIEEKIFLRRELNKQIERKQENA